MSTNYNNVIFRIQVMSKG